MKGMRRMGMLAVAAILCGQCGWTGEPFMSVLNAVESPRAAAMGGVMAGLAKDQNLAWNNPSCMPEAGSSSVTLGGMRGFEDDVAVQGLGVFSVANGGGLAVGGAWYRGGDGGAGAANSGDRVDGMGILGASGRSGPVRAGFTAKYLRSTLREDYGAGAAAFDAAVCVDFWEAWSAGVLAQNLSGGIRFEKEDLSLPSMARLGLSRTWADSFGRLTLAMDGVRDVARRKYGWAGGVEYHWAGSVAVRVGMGQRTDREGIGFSLGLGYEGRHFRLDYATRVETTQQSPQLLNLTIFI